MRIFFILFIVLSFCDCKSSKTNRNPDSYYLVTRIKRLNNWHIIYASKQDTLYKITSEKVDRNNQHGERIRVGHRYPFKLQSRTERIPYIIDNGKRIQLTAVGVECFGYDQETVICIEPEKGIYDLHFADNLKGLYFVK